MKNKKNNSFSKSSYFILFLLLCNNLFSQTENQKKNIDSAFVNYSKLYQEVVHAHLNKSTYLVGESIGFTSYVLNKKNSNLSTITKNLYCVITDKNSTIIKQKLVKVDNGIANNIFEIDSLFTSGDYTFKAYTNWMLNFKQQNYFIQPFKVIDLEKEDYIKKAKPNQKLDVQFLPEGGHLINNVITTIGVIAKDSLGFGIPNIEGVFLDDENTIITDFTLNKMGIGRFSFLPNQNKKYRAEINYNGKKEIFYFKNNIETKGVHLKIANREEDIFVSLVTNKATIKELKNKRFILANYNSDKLEKIEFNFSEKEIITKKISHKKLVPGINVFTLFNEENHPIAERLFFNYQGISIIKGSKPTIIRITNDSLTLKINYKDFNSSKYNNVSVSILPANTKSYFRNSNIISQTLIQPYVKGRIENGGYYFTNINERKKYDLDNLLLTQGWSSYDWKDLFKKDFNLKHAFENGIDLQINLPDKEEENQILVHHSSNRLAEVIKIKKGISSFKSSGYYLIENEELKISKLDKKGKLSPASLYIQYKPNKFSYGNIANSNLLNKPFYYTSENDLDSKLITKSLKNTQNLNEIVLKVKVKNERIEKIKNTSFGQVYVFDEDNPFRNFDIFSFLTTKGFYAERVPFSNQVILINRISATLNGSTVPAVFIDGFLVNDLNQLTWLDTSIIDYIKINRTGTGEGLRGGAGSIRIVTDPFKTSSRKRTTTRKFTFPITFSESKKFYTPIYKNYYSKFYKSYGTIDWLPINIINKNGDLILKFKNNQPNNIKLFIEGITNNGEFIFEEKTIELE